VRDIMHMTTSTIRSARYRERLRKRGEPDTRAIGIALFDATAAALRDGRRDAPMSDILTEATKTLSARGFESTSVVMAIERRAGRSRWSSD
jgi:hypothetical protein